MHFGYRVRRLRMAIISMHGVNGCIRDFSLGSIEATIDTRLFRLHGVKRRTNGIADTVLRPTQTAAPDADHGCWTSRGCPCRTVLAFTSISTVWLCTATNGAGRRRPV
jgi:hypothetical protein